jgi:WD40-like Beta Propeller Repeat
MVLTDWSPDGKFVTFYTGVLLLVPVTTNQPALERKAFEWLREDFDALQGRFSPDGRHIAFLSNEADPDRLEVYVRPFDPNKPEAPAGPPVRVSKNGAIGMITWREDAKEMYFITRDWEVMAVDITTTPTFQGNSEALVQNARPAARKSGTVEKRQPRRPAIRFRDADHRSNECSLKAGVGKAATQQTASGRDCISVHVTCSEQCTRRGPRDFTKPKADRILRRRQP